MLPVFQLLGTHYKSKTIVTKLIDEKSKLNEQTWLNSCIAVGELLAELYSDKEGADDET